MIDFNNLSGRDKLIAAFLGLLLVAGVIENAPALLILLIIFGFLYTSRRDNRQEEASYYSDDDYEAEIVAPEPIRQERPASAEQIHRHALRAVRRAGINPNETRVLPVDIGILAFRGEDDPIIHHERPIDNDVDYVQPFVELRVPTGAQGSIRFEVIDNTGQVVFVHTDRYELKRGRNLIIPAARLPIHDERMMDGDWEMRVQAGDLLLARHVFGWRDADGSNLRPYVAQDGEISSELRAVLAENRLQQMSLDELLAHQDDDQQQEAEDGRK